MANAHEHEQNGQAENMVKHVTQGGDACRRAAGLTTPYWQLATQYFCDTRMRLPVKAASALPEPAYRTPIERLERRTIPFKTLTERMRPFGVRAYVYVPKAVRAHTHT